MKYFKLFALFALLLVLSEATPKRVLREDEDDDDFEIENIEVKAYASGDASCSGNVLFTYPRSFGTGCLSPRSIVTRKFEKIEVNSRNNMTISVYDKAGCSGTPSVMTVIKNKCVYDYGIDTYAKWDWEIDD